MRKTQENKNTNGKCKTSKRQIIFIYQIKNQKHSTFGQERQLLTKVGAPQSFGKQLQPKKTIVDIDFMLKIRHSNVISI